MSKPKFLAPNKFKSSEYVEIPSKPEEPMNWRIENIKMTIKRLQGLVDDYEAHKAI